MQEFWAAATAELSAAVVQPPAAPGPRRTRLIVGVSASVLVLDIVLAITGFALQLRSGMHRPPTVKACGLVPAAVVEELIPGGSGSPNTVGDGLCGWQPPRTKKVFSSADLTLTVHPYPHDYGSQSYEQDRSRDQGDHLTHPVPGLRAYSWATLSTGAATAEAHALVADYRITVQWRPPGEGRPAAQAEQDADQVIRAVAAGLAGSRA
jgi:hypothetical protein